MTTIDQSIDVDVPVRQAYNQWTQFEEFPEFMEGIEEVKQLDDTRLHWVASVAGQRQEWDAVIVEQVPDERVQWRSISGKASEGLVRFDKVGENKTRLHVQIAFEPEGLTEKAGGVLGVASARVKADLERFKNFIESRRHETGAWRGEVHSEQVTNPAEGSPRSKRIHGASSGSTS